MSSVNNTYQHGGRLGNLFFVGMALHFIAVKNKLKVAYKYHDSFKKLGIKLFVGQNTYKETIQLLDTNFYNFIRSDELLDKNVSIVNNVWCQTEEFSFFLKNYFLEDINKINIINNNIFKTRYNNNNDIFIHVRLGDISDTIWIHPFSYYDKALSGINFENGYISSDSINHQICNQLITKYNLKIINYNEIETIMFASTCNNIVLSSGSFSWMIGLFSYYSTVYYPKIYNKWHGNIFVFPEWNEISY